MFIKMQAKLLGLTAFMFCAINVAGAGMPAPVPFGSYYSESSMLSPLTLAQRPTTDGRIYQANLDATIASLTEAVGKREPDVLRLQLARSLYHRFRVEGRLADLDQARVLAMQTTIDMPVNAGAWLFLAKLQSAYHEFAPALESLEKAARLNASVDEIAIIRYEIEQAQEGGMKVSDLSTLSDPQQLAEFVQRANEAINQGDLGQADRLLTQAQYHYQDSNPFPLAWLHVQHGIAFLRFGDPARARVFFQAARERLPSYYLANEHLAETELLLGNFQAAALLYQATYQQTQNPEFLGGLADAQFRLNEPQANANRNRALAEYKSLLEEYPTMYWQHAAKFYLRQGDSGTAMMLAKRNLGIRQDLQSLILFASAAAEAGSLGPACRTFDKSIKSGASPPELIILQDQLNPLCGGNDRRAN